MPSHVTWEQMSITQRQQAKVEKGESIDSTVTDTPIHAPALWDSVRVLVRAEQQELAGRWNTAITGAKKRMRAIVYTRGQDKKAALPRR